MLTLITLLIVSIPVIGFLTYQTVAAKKGWCRKDNFDKFLGLFFVPLVAMALLCFALSLMDAGIVGSVLPTRWVVTGSEKLHSLKPKEQTEGSFFLGSGSINGVAKYAYMKVLSDGGYKYGEVDAKDAVIYEENRQDAELDHLTNEPDTGSQNGWIRFLTELGGPDDTKVEVHVPKGSVDNRYFVSP